MNPQRQLSRNIVMSAVQVGMVGVSFFFLYRYLLRELGEDLFGVWAVVLSTSAASAIANLGIANAATKYVARYVALGDENRVADVIQTAFLSLTAFMGLVLAGAYPILQWLLGKLIDDVQLVGQARDVLPYALVALWLTSSGTVLLSSLDGFQRVDLRNIIYGTTSLLYLGLAYVLVPMHGLIGVAEAQFLQAAYFLVSAWLVLKRRCRELPLIPVRWSKSVFREMLSYSLQFQVISVSSILLAPTTSALMVKFGGLSLAGYYEMARRMVSQLRALFVTTHQAVVPAIADLQERNPEKIRDLYAGSFRMITFLIIPTLPFVIGMTPFISRIWIGSYEPFFVFVSVVLFVAWFFNLLSNSAYFANVGTGELRWNVVGHLMTGVLNAVLGGVLGAAFGGSGVVIGLAVGIVAGSAAVVFAYHRRYRIRIKEMLRGAGGWLAIASLAGMSALLLLDGALAARLSPIWAGPLLVLLYGAIVIVPIWKHPVRIGLQERIMQQLAARPRHD